MPVRSVALLVIVLVAGGAYALVRGDGPAFLHALRRIPPTTWAGVVGLALLSYGLRAVRWRGLLNHQGHRLPAGAALTIYVAGFALTLSPGKAGETVRAFYLMPWGVPVGVGVAVFVAERLLDLMAVGALSVPALEAFAGFRWVGPVVVVAVVGIVVLIRRRVLPGLVARVLGRAAGEGLGKAVDPLRALLHPRVLLRWSGLTLLAWGCQGLAFDLVVTGLGYACPVPTLVATYCLAILVGALSMMPGGLGATEVVLVLLLEQLGLGSADALAAGLVTRGLTLWLAVLLGSLATARLAWARSPAPGG